MSTTVSGQSFRGRRVLVVGLGLHGGAASAIRWLSKQGAQLLIQDRKTQPELVSTLNQLKKIRATYHLGRHPLADVDWAEFVYVNQGVPHDHPIVRRARKLQRPLLNETTLFFQACPAPIVGVTGTRGKSTTTVLIGKILTAAKRRPTVAGNLRQTMMLDVLQHVRAPHPVVLELSSFQLEYLPLIERSPHVAIMTNLKVDHLNRYDSMADYANAKYNIFRFQKSSDIAVLNAENAWTRRAASLTKAQVWWFQTQGQHGRHGVTVHAGWVSEYHGRTSHRLFPVTSIRLVGKHNLENILAAVATARALEIPIAPIRQAVQHFAGVPHRQELIRTWRGHQFINDTTATTPDGTLAAVDVFPKAVFIIGGTDKHLQFSQLAQELQRRRIPLVFLPGTATQKILAALRRAGDQRQHHVADSMQAVVHQAEAMAKPKQTIVLSPGAASFGLFVHEFDRGEQFVRAVQHLR